MTKWFEEAFLPSLFQRTGINSGLWLTQRQTAICAENMICHSVRDRDTFGDMCSRLYYDCRWNGREVMMQYSKLNGCGMISFGMDAAETQEQERKNQQERDSNEIKHLKRRFERHPEKFFEDMQAVIEEIAETECELNEHSISERFVIRCQQDLSELRKTLAWMQEIKNQAHPAG
jgi:hypothetical protein